MWWKYAGFGRFIILNDLAEAMFEDNGDGKKTHVRPGRLSKVEVSGQSFNTVWGNQKAVTVSLNEKGQLQKPGTRGEVHLGWSRLLGPPVPDTWTFDYSIAAPDNEQTSISGRIALPTPRGQRSIMRFTFHYALDDHRNAWYAVKTDRLNWSTETWELGDTKLLGDSPAVHAATEASRAS